MAYEHLTEELPELFPVPSDPSTRVQFNPNKLKFMLLAQPSLDELRLAIEQYAEKRLEARWAELMQPNSTNRSITAFIVLEKKMVHIEQGPVQRLMGEPAFAPFLRRVRAMSLEEQRVFIQALKPKTIAEMLALYRNTAVNDITGYRYLHQVLDESRTAVDFFGKLTDALFTSFAQSDYTLGSPKPGFHQPRIFEFLGMSLTRGWLLFPFITGQSGINEIRALMHRDNTQRYLHPMFGPIEAGELAVATRELVGANSSYAIAAKYIERLVVSSTYRSIAQSSTELFERCVALVNNGQEDVHRQIGYARRGYNALLKLHNSHYPAAPRQPQLVKEKVDVSLVDFASFGYLEDVNPKLKHWADRMSAFVRSTVNAPGSGLVRKTACNDFCEFLVELSDAPLLPELVGRSLINDFTEAGQCYRNFLRKKYASPESCNTKLGELSQFFHFVQDRLRIEHKGELKDVPWFVNPVDIRLDKFVTQYRAGTTRKTIGADIMEEMRSILVADGYAWSKQWKGDWTHLVNEDTKELEYVWSPSAAICLYTLLSLPLRGLQARMLDSGEGDAEIFDFDKKAMVPNLNQLPVNDRVDTRRKEGFLQIMASGLTSEPELVGMWICVNKTSESGYSIPWVSHELLEHLRYQRDWIFRYAHHPKMQAIEDAQGHRNTPKEWVDRQQRFYCLFRDPSAERMHDNSLPVSKQKLLRLWGRLCLETQNRMNARATNEMQRVRLVKPGTEEQLYPTAIHDLHTLRVSGITDLLDRGVPLNIVSEYIAGHATYIMTLWYDKPAPGTVRQAMLQASKLAGDKLGALPRFSEEELEDMKPFLLSNPDFQGLYTGFDALEDNVGLVQFRQAGICPGTRCEEGGLSDTGRQQAVPVGDRGPSCPQCRFWLTGPAFLLGQTIEGNQLILKIRKKVASLAKVRERILDAEDAGDSRRADLLRGQTDVEERQLNDMLTEWWHRMRFYESSIGKLEEYRKACDAKVHSSIEGNIMLFKHDYKQPSFGYSAATELELKHFLSTCAEVLPDLSDETLAAHQDIELAVGKFLAINDEQKLTSLFFQLSDAQRLTAANLTVELMMRASSSPLKASDLLEGKVQLQAMPNLQDDISKLFLNGQTKSAIGATPTLKVGGRT